MKAPMSPLRRRQLEGFVCRNCIRQLTRQKRNYASQSVTSKPDIYDVVCVGGGPAGLSLLAALSTCQSWYGHRDSNRMIQEHRPQPKTYELHLSNRRTSPKLAPGHSLPSSIPTVAPPLHHHPSAFSSQ